MTGYTTRYFTIDFGELAGAYCSHCGRKITPYGGDSGMIFECECDQAFAEAKLIRAKENADAHLQLFYNQLDNTKRQLIEIKVRRDAHLAIADAYDAEIMRLDSLKTSSPVDFDALQRKGVEYIEERTAPVPPPLS